MKNYILFGNILLLTLFVTGYCGKSREILRDAKLAAKASVKKACHKATSAMESALEFMSGPKLIPIIYQDATDFDNFIALENILNEHKMLDQCFKIAKENDGRTTPKEITNKLKLHFVLIGRPAVFGVPLHTRDQLEDMRKSNFKEKLTSDILGATMRDKTKDTTFKSTYLGDLLDLIVTANQDWETGKNYNWVLQGKGNTRFAKAVEEDSKLVQEANALKYMLLIQAITGNSMSHIRQCVVIYDGEIATHDQPSDPNANFAKLKRKLLAYLSYRVHVLDINQITMDGKMADREAHKKQYYEQMNIPEDGSNFEDKKFKQMKDDDKMYVKLGKHGEYELVDLLEDHLLGERRERVRALLKTKMTTVEGMGLHGFGMKSIAVLQKYLKSKEVVEFDVMGLAPFNGLALTIVDGNGKPIDEILDKMHHVITVACTGKYGKNLFHDNFNLVGDSFASYIFFTKVAEWQKKKRTSHHNNHKAGWPLVMVVPSHIGKVNVEKDKEGKLVYPHSPKIEEYVIDMSAKILLQKNSKQQGAKQLMGVMYDTWNYAKGQEKKRTLNGEEYKFELQGIFDLPANDWLYLTHYSYIHPHEFQSVREQKLSETGKTAWDKKKVEQYTMIVPQFENLTSKKFGAWKLEPTHTKANEPNVHHVAAYVMDWDETKFN